MKAKGKARTGNGTDPRAAALVARTVNAARAWAAALVAKLEGLADEVRAVDELVRPGANDGPGGLIAGAMNREVLNDIAIDLHRLTETAAGLIAADAGAELPDLIGEAKRVGELLAAN